MIPMLESMFAHMAWADDAILAAVAGQEGAYADEEIRKLLHHIVTVQRFFFSLMQTRSTEDDWKKPAPETLDEMRRLFAEAHADGAAYTARLDDAELARTIQFPIMKEFQPPVRDALVQVAMHSEHHRAQVAARLRALGAKPPVTDYIMWVRVGKSAAA